MKPNEGDSVGVSTHTPLEDSTWHFKGGSDSKNSLYYRPPKDRYSVTELQHPSRSCDEYKCYNYDDGGSVPDLVNHPPHYGAHPSGVECITITEHMNFCLGNAVKYIWRAGLKSASTVEDLRKSVWYIQREIDRLENHDE